MNIGPRGEGRWVVVGLYVRKAGIPCMPIHPAGSPTPAQALGFLGPWASDVGRDFGGLLPAAFWAANDPLNPEANPADILRRFLPSEITPENVRQLREWLNEEVPPEG